MKKTKAMRAVKTTRFKAGTGWGRGTSGTISSNGMGRAMGKPGKKK